MRRAARFGCSALALIAAAAAIGITVARQPAPPPIPLPAPTVTAPQGAPNILLLTVDDMNWDSSGVYGNPLTGITPNIDALAQQGARFEEAYVTSPICQPSRSAWMTGRYPPSNGAVGFLPINPGVPTLPETLRNAGWRIGILAKNTHTPPLDPRAWDYWVTPAALGVGRDPEAFYRETHKFITDSQKAGRPFFLNANIQDPHRPFPGGQRAWWGKLLEFMDPQGEFPPEPPRFASPSQVPVPAFLPDLPEVREELVQYYTAVHRADQSVGRILLALRETGADKNTIVVFASDNGMAFPFGKQTLYQAGLRTQLIVRWPGRIAAGQVVKDIAPSGIDVMPTLLNAAGVPAQKPVDGQSFLTRITEGVQSAPTSQPVAGYVDRVDIPLPLVPRQELSYPSRSIVSANFIYIWNQWADGKKPFISETQTGLTYNALKKAAERDKQIAARLKFYQMRTGEELYDRQSDPASLRNLASASGNVAQLVQARKMMLDHLARTHDPQLQAYRTFLTHRK